MLARRSRDLVVAIALIGGCAADGHATAPACGARFTACEPAAPTCDAGLVCQLGICTVSCFVNGCRNELEPSECRIVGPTEGDARGYCAPLEGPLECRAERGDSTQVPAADPPHNAAIALCK